MEDIHAAERWRLETTIDYLRNELDEMRQLLATLEEVLAYRQRGLNREAAALLDDLQRNWAALMRDKYPDPR